MAAIARSIRLARAALFGLLVCVLGIDVLFAVVQLGHMDLSRDFRGYQDAVAAWTAGSGLYDKASDGILFWRWSPIAVFLIWPVTAMGIAAWRVLNLAAVLALRDWRLIALVATSWPFWYGMKLGSVFPIVFVAAALALRGNRPAGAVYLGLCLLMPRPLMAPLALLLLWRRPSWRLPFVVVAVASVAAAAVTGYLAEWTATLVSSGSELNNPTNLGPSVPLGPLWLLIGIPVGIWAFMRGRMGIASLAVSPYWLPYYLLFLGLEFVRVGPDLATPPAAASPPGIRLPGPAA